MSDDLIDFPVSNLWRDYYYEVGLTAHPSSGYISGPDRAMIEVLSEIRDALTSLLGDEAVLPLRQAPSRPYRPPSKPAPPTQEPTIRRL